MRGVSYNPGYEDDPFMDIVTADYLEWTLLDNGTYVEVESEYWDYIFDLDDILWVYYTDSDKIAYKRNCKDLEHAQHVAGAIEIMAIRKHKEQEEK